MRLRSSKTMRSLGRRVESQIVEAIKNVPSVPRDVPATRTKGYREDRK